MARTVSIGAQNFEEIIKRNNFYVDKTKFIKEWWDNEDIVTLITRPRRFGKTLNMNMLERFFSVKYRERGEVFEGLDIWDEAKYRKLQGTYPVIFLTFADVKQDNLNDAIKWIKSNLWGLYEDNRFLLEGDVLSEIEKKEFKNVIPTMDDTTAQDAIRKLMKFLSRYYGKKVILLLDEYDTPLQEAYTGGYWKELVSFTRSMFNSMFKTNPYLERAVMTGITRVSKESLFSDLNNLNVVTITSDEYASCFGFTEKEVFEAMDEFGMSNKEEVKYWYNGFTVGKLNDIYNPWSIINFLKKKKLKPYWVNTSSNVLISNIIRMAGKAVKMKIEELLQGGSIVCEIDEEIIFNQLDVDENAIWSLLLASGYLTALNVDDDEYELVITNYEVEKMFKKMVKGWFSQDGSNYSGFIKALLAGNLKEMNLYMNQVTLSMFSTFDGGRHPSAFSMPENFYHGFVLGLLVELSGKYIVTSNRESGFGRYDVMLEPMDKDMSGIILEFKVHDPDDEKDMSETVHAALKQIEDKQYDHELICRGIKKENIRKYGFAFEGKKVLIGDERNDNFI